MKKIHTSIRLKEIMEERNLRQADVLRLAEPFIKKYGERLGKNDLSQYLSGKTEPGQRKLFVLGKALNVNPSWLMGMDVSKEVSEVYKKNDILTDIVLKFQSDDEFREITESIYNASPELLKALKAFISAFEQ